MLFMFIIMMLCAPGIALLVHHINVLQSTVRHLDQQLVDNNVAGARLSDGSYIPLQIVVEAEDAAQYEYSSTHYDVYAHAGGSDHDDHKQIPSAFAWVKSAPVSTEEYWTNHCAAFHSSDCNCEEV